MSCCNSARCNVQTPKPNILAVILDLDGTLLDTGILTYICAVYLYILNSFSFLRNGFSFSLFNKLCVLAERATKGVLKEFLAKYDKVLAKEREEKKTLGMTLKDSSAAIVKDYDLPLTPDQYIQEIIPMYQEK